jgi:KaiC/GvpD/RAD55 family RecA-like ATPase
MSFKTIPNKNLSIDKQQMTCDEMICDDIPPPLSSYSATYLVVGSPGSGKTNWLVDILSKNKKKGLRCGLAKCYNHIIIVSPSLATLKNNIFKDLDDNKKYTEFNDEVLDFIIEFTNEKAEENEHTLVIFDDITTQLKKSQALQRKLGYLIFNRRHRFLSFMILVQRYIDTPSIVRDALTHLVLFKPTNRREVEYISNEILPVTKDKVHELLSFVYDKKYNFLFVDLSLKHSSDYIYYKNFDEIIF